MDLAVPVTTINKSAVQRILIDYLPERFASHSFRCIDPASIDSFLMSPFDLSLLLLRELQLPHGGPHAGETV